MHMAAGSGQPRKKLTSKISVSDYNVNSFFTFTCTSFEEHNKPQLATVDNFVFGCFTFLKLGY